MVDEQQLLYLEQEVQEMMEAFEGQSHERVWNKVFRSLPESKGGIESYPDLVNRIAALCCLIERALDASEDSYLKTKLAESIEVYFSVEPGAAGGAPFAVPAELEEQLFSFYNIHEKAHPDTIAFFDSPLQSTIAASWLLAANPELDPARTAYLPIVRVPEVLSMHTNHLLLRQPYVQKWEPESVFMHAVSLARKRTELASVKKIENAFVNANRLHGWLFREIIDSLGLVFEEGIIRPPDGHNVEEPLEQDVVIHVRDRLCQAVPSKIADQIKGTSLKLTHFAVAQRVSLWGDFDAGWMFLLRFLERRLPDAKTAKLLASMEMPCRDWWAFPEIAIATRRPIACGVDENFVPHREFGKAIEFADGFGVYAINGQRISEEEFKEQTANSGS